MGLTGKSIPLNEARMQREEEVCLFKRPTPSKRLGYTKKQGNMTLPKEKDKMPENDPKETQLYELPDKECEITVNVK